MTAAMHQAWPEPDPQHAPPEPEPRVHLTPLPDVVDLGIPDSRVPAWSTLLVFPLAVALTVLAIGGFRSGDATAMPAPVATVAVRDASGSLAAAGDVRDRLAGHDIEVLSLVRSRVTVAKTEIRFEGPHGLAQAKAVRQALGTGTILRWGSRAGQTEITVLLGKDVLVE